MNYLEILLVFGLFLTLGHCDSIEQNGNSNITNELRQICPEGKIIFDLFTRKNPHTPQSVLPDKDHILKSNHDPEKENKIIAHGYKSSPNGPEFVQMKDAYLARGDYNVWMVDWSLLAQFLAFSEAPANAPVPYLYLNVVQRLDQVGQCIAQLINEILKISKVPSNAIHFIGHSLGAHLGGYTSKHLGSYKLARITGLDPARPLFETGLIGRSLAKGDAEFVDIVHTNAEILGKPEPLGDIDFYPNGGMLQPGCLPVDLSCSHSRSVAYFAESILSNVGFYGWFCENYQQYLENKCATRKPEELMGEYVDKKKKGVYIVPTRGKPLYAWGVLYGPSQNNENMPMALQHENRRNFTTLADYWNKIGTRH